MVLAYAVMALVWPWSVLDPLNPFRAVEYFSHFFEKPWQELFGGRLICVPDMPRSYVPTLFALKLPEIFSVLGFGGAVGALVAALRRDIAANRRAVLLLLALAALLPLAVTIALRPAMYNGIRHFVFVLPPLAVLGGLAAVWLFDARLRAVPIRAPLRPPPSSSPASHRRSSRWRGCIPTNTPISTGSPAASTRARDRYMLDYWGLSFKQASQALLAKLAERHETKPADRRWKIAVCGPHRSPQVELGPDFETTWDPAGRRLRDDAGGILLREVRAPLLAEIVRDGVIFARVYDIRGRSFPTLLTRPGLDPHVLRARHASRFRLRCLWDAVRRARRHRPASRRGGSDADRFSEIWRTKQLEYTWTLTLAGRYVDFWTLTERALDYAFARFPSVDRALKPRLLDAYLTLDGFPDARPACTSSRRAAIHRDPVERLAEDARRCGRRGRDRRRPRRRPLGRCDPPLQAAPRGLCAGHRALQVAPGDVVFVVVEPMGRDGRGALRLSHRVGQSRQDAGGIRAGAGRGSRRSRRARDDGGEAALR